MTSIHVMTTQNHAAGRNLTVKTIHAVSLLFLLVAAMVAGCAPAAEQDTVPPAALESPTPWRIALVMKTLTNPFFVEMERGARQAEDEFEIDLIVRTAAQETSIEQQIQIVTELIRDKVDAIVIAPGDSVGLIPVLKQAQDAGIVVINIDNRLDADFSQSQGLVGVPFISVDNEEGAYLSALAISERITTPTEAIILEGIREARNAQDRKAGALRAFAENPNITVVASETANWKIDEAYEVTAQLFEQHPAIGAIFAANDMMSLGAIQYLTDQHRDDVLVAAFDALDEARQALRDGTLVATIDQQAARQGYLGVEYAMRALNGETLPAETMIDVLLVTAATLEQ
jgi:ribose transport system substrate-binding protein